MVRLKFEDLNSAQLWRLRKEIVLNSLFVGDYDNSFGFAKKSVMDFFDGYMSYLYELAEENHGKKAKDFSVEEVINKYDNEDNLFDYYWGEDYSWFEYEPEFSDKDNEAYENYWNN